MEPSLLKRTGSMISIAYTAYRKTHSSFAAFLCLLTVWTGVNLNPAQATAQGAKDILTLSMGDMSAGDQTIYITDSWKFREGDDLSWASPSLADSSWQKVSTYLGPSELPFIEWKGIGWFRLHFRVDSSLVSYPLALLTEQHNGASEVYLNGILIYKLGEVSPFREGFNPYRDFYPRPLVIPDTTAHVLAVRYANHNTDAYNAYGFTAGFRFLIGDLNYHIASSIEERTSTPWAQIAFAGCLLVFTFIHFLLFAFYPSEKRNLFFAFFTGFLALLSLTLILAEYTSSPLLAISYLRISLITWILTTIYALRFSYSLFYEKPPVRFWFFLAAGLGLAAGTWFNADGLGLYRELFVVITLLEIIRVLAISFFRRKKDVWIIGTGLVCFVAGIMYTALANVNIINADPVYGNLYGSVFLVLALSVYLSKGFAHTHRRLEHKLEEVKQLSERSLEQERINREQEIKRKLLEAENRRKSDELEEARALQLSMLPRQIPDTDYWDIAVFMETAQEVGGDYYDFSVSNNGTLSIVVGDATGHGMKAGIMVATAKSYFHTLVNEHNNIDMIRRISSGIRSMDLKMMYMGMMVFRCVGHRIRYTSAGMPPVLHYSCASGQVNRLVLKSMPLGGKVEYPYEEKEIGLSPGDSLLLMSDGLMELFNEERELLGLSRIEQVFKEAAASSSASNIISQITKLIDRWAGSQAHEDDITVLALKAKGA